MGVSIAWRLQHHPRRDLELQRLLASAPDVPWRVVADPLPDGHSSAWRTYTACLRSVENEDRAVIVQDDAVCVPGFKIGVEAAAELHPDRIVAFFHGTFPPVARKMTYDALRKGEPFWEVPGGRWIPTVALMLPAALARDLFDWSLDKVKPDFRGDDSVLGRWSRHRNQTALVTSMSLVQHPDDTPSLVGSSNRRPRNAIVLAETAQDWISLLSPPVSSIATAT